MSTPSASSAAKAEKEKKRESRPAGPGQTANISTVEVECHAIPATAEGNQAERHATQHGQVHGQEVGQDQPLLLGLNTIAEILNSHLYPTHAVSLLL